MGRSQCVLQQQLIKEQKRLQEESTLFLIFDGYTYYGVNLIIVF